MRLVRMVVLVVLALTLASVSSADDVDQARELFRKGSSLAQDTQWAAALSAFEHSAALRPHPWTTYNMAVCERALGQYVRARATFARSLSERTLDADLPEATVRDVSRFEQEIDSLLASLDVSLDPADAAIAVDGAPLVVDATATETTLVAGLSPSGKPTVPPARTFRLILDPGTHVIVVVRTGFADAALSESVRPGERRALAIRVSELPASVRINATEPNAVVKVDQIDVGTVPLLLSRPAGVHHVVVEKSGFDSFETDAKLSAGQRVDLSVQLKATRPSLFTRWWFWTLAGAVVAGATVTTYALTRPAPERPPVDMGGLGWAAKIP